MIGPARVDSAKRSVGLPRLPLLLLLLLLSVAPFLPAIRGTAIWDDHQLLSGEAIGGGIDFLSCFTRPFGAHYYRPVVSAFFFLERRLWGDWLPGYHLTNLALHAVGTFAVCGLFGAIFRERRTALIGAAIFAIHPVNVGPTAWIGGITDSLCEAFLAVALWTAALAGAADRRKQMLLIFASSIAFAGAIGSKEQALAACPLPSLIGWLARPGEETRCRRAAMSITAIYALFGIVSLAAMFHVSPLPLRSFDPAYQITIAGETLLYYSLVLVLATPGNLHSMTLAFMERFGPASSIVGWAILASGLFLTWRWRRSRPALSWCLAALILMLMPVSNIVSPPSLALIAPWRGALASIGLAGVLGFASASAWRAGGRRRGITLAIGSAYGLWLLSMSIWGSAQWQSQFAIDSAFARYDPDCIFTRKKLAGDLLAEGKRSEAVKELEATLDRVMGSQRWADPSAAPVLAGNDRVRVILQANHGADLDVPERLADLFWTLGFTRTEAGDALGAVAAYQVGRTLYPQHSGINVALARMAIQGGDLSTASAYLQAAAKGGSTEALGLLGWIDGQKGDWTAAAEKYRLWTRIAPGNPDAWLHLAEAQLKLGQNQEAERTLELGRDQSGLSKDAAANLLQKAPGAP